MKTIRACEITQSSPREGCCEKHEAIRLKIIDSISPLHNLPYPWMASLRCDMPPAPLASASQSSIYPLHPPRARVFSHARDSLSQVVILGANLRHLGDLGKYWGRFVGRYFADKIGSPQTNPNPAFAEDWGRFAGGVKIGSPQTNPNCFCERFRYELLLIWGRQATHFWSGWREYGVGESCRGRGLGALIGRLDGGSVCASRGYRYT